MPIFEGTEPINYGDFLREQKGLNDKVMRLQWKALMKELCRAESPGDDNEQSE